MIPAIEISYAYRFPEIKIVIKIKPWKNKDLQTKMILHIANEDRGWVLDPAIMSMNSPSRKAVANELFEICQETAVPGSANMTKRLPFTELRIRRAIGAVRKTGLDVAAVEVQPDGTVTIHTVEVPSKSRQNGKEDEWADA